MGIFRTVKKYFQENWFSISAISLIVLIVWHKILVQVPNGEGFIYFSPLNALVSGPLNLKFFLQENSLLAKIIFAFLMPVLKDKLVLYMMIQLIIMLLVYQLFYFVILKITKDRGTSFLTTVFFVANYVGSFTMLGIGNYHRFVQRVPNLILIFTSFYLMANYLEKGKTKNLSFALFLYLISIFLSHYNVFFLPVFIIYPLIYFLFNRQPIAGKKVVLLSTFYLLSSLLLIREDSLSRPSYSPFRYMSETSHVAQMVLYQISSTAFPQQLTLFISTHALPPIPYPYLQTQNLVLGFLAIILAIAIPRGKKYRKLFPLFLTFVLSSIILSFLTVYSYDSVPNPLKFFDEDRIYFVHSILMAFIWAAMVKFFFGGHKRYYQAAAALIALVFLLSNISLIWRGMDRYQYRSNMYKSFIKYINSLSLTVTDKSVIVAPPDLIRTTEPFIRRYYNLGKTTFIVLENNWIEQVAETKIDKKDIFVLDYKYNYDSKGDIDPSSVMIVDKSDDFRLNKDVKPFMTSSAD